MTEAIQQTEEITFGVMRNGEMKQVSLEELTDKELRSCVGHGGLSLPSEKEAAELTRRGLLPTRNDLVSFFL